MLIEFTVGNYRSFKEPVTLSMIATQLKSKDPVVDQNNILDLPDNPSLLISAAIYGANASGKSNLIQALDFMRDFVLNSPKETRPTGGIDSDPFRLSAKTVKEPSHFEIVFIVQGKRYRYGFEVTKERVNAEWLYFVPSTREATLFERQGDHFKIGSYFKEGRDIEEHTRPNALFLSVVAQFNGLTAQMLVHWFRRLGIISGLEDIDKLIFSLNRLLQGEQADSIKELICRLDLGITDLLLEKEPRKTPSLPDDARQAFMIGSGEQGEQLRVKTVHMQTGEADVPAEQVLFDLSEQESEGTQKLFAMSGPLIRTLQSGYVLVVDELDARLHPLMTREIISLFNNRESNPNGAQLIFSSQDTNLLDNTLFRRDQIWFLEKDQQGASHLYSLAEFRVRNDKDYERGYIQGRYGAIPNIGQIHTIVSEEYA